MKIALIGSGKTGSHVADLISKDDQLTIFNRSNPPTVKQLVEHQVAICFVPGKAMLELLPSLLEAKIPVVTGATGFDWPQDFDKTLQEHGLSWISASNFSIGMNIMFYFTRKLASLQSQLPKASFSIAEVHHTEKVDCPSGTALSLQKLLQTDVPIEAKREGDVKGIHQLDIDFEYEKLSIRHEAKERAVFAKGAVWAAKQILTNAQFKKGLILFEDYLSERLENNKL